MNTFADEPAERFVPVSETMRDRALYQRFGASWSQSDLVVLFAISLLAVLVRLYHLEVWSVSAAEAQSWRLATRAEGGGYTLVEVGLRALFESELLPSHGEGWLRLPFLFLSTLAVPLLALVGDVVVGRRAALLAAGGLALHPWHVEVCQSATGHGVALTVALLALGSGWVTSRTRRRASWLLLACLIVLAGMCHPTGWLVLPTLIMGWQFHAWRRADTRDRVGLVAGAMFLLLAVVLVVRWLRPANVTGDPAALLEVSVGWLAAIGLPLLVLAMLAPAIAPGRSRWWPLVLLVAIVPIAIAAVLGAMAVPPARDHALMALPVLLLLASLAALSGFDRVHSELGGGRSIAVLLPSSLFALALMLDLAIGTMLYSTAQRGSRPDWRGARDQVIHRAERSSLEVLAAAGHASLVYYLRPDHWRDAKADPHPGIVVSKLDLGVPVLSQHAASAASQSADLFVVLLEGELASFREVDDSQGLVPDFELISVLPCAGTAHDETIYLYRWVGSH